MSAWDGVRPSDKTTSLPRDRATPGWTPSTVYISHIITRTARQGVSNTPEHSNDIYLPSSSLIGDPDAMAWLRDLHPSHLRTPCACHTDQDGRTRTVLARAPMSSDL